MAVNALLYTWTERGRLVRLIPPLEHASGYWRTASVENTSHTMHSSLDQSKQRRLVIKTNIIVLATHFAVHLVKILNHCVTQ